MNQVVRDWRFPCALILSVGLTIAYVNTFVLWRLLQIHFADAAPWVPFGLVGLVGVVFALPLVRRRSLHDGWSLLVALALAGLGLWLTDPQFPAKRIHVPQYALLAAVLYIGASRRIHGWPLACAAWSLASLFGIHDELMQGLHPQRTYGYMDMIVNALGAGAGALACHGLYGRADATPWPPLREGAWLAVGFSALVLMLVILLSYRNVVLPLWLPLPILAAGWGWAFARDKLQGPWRALFDAHMGLIAACSFYVYGMRYAQIAFA